MTIEQIVQTWGYPALFVGTFLEGETILIMGGFAAHRGFLSLPWVIVAALAGSLAGDQFYFLVGRLKGQAFLERRPSWRPAADRAKRLLARHHTPLILGFRFLYGLRTVTPFVLGASGVPPLRFAVLNAAGAAFWAVTFALLGYFFGNVMEAVLVDLKKVEVELLGLIALAGLGYWLYRACRDRADPPPEK